MKVKELWIYPIKAMSGISLKEAECQARGFKHDRRYLLVDEKGQFITQREFSEMARFKCSLKEDHILVKYNGSELKLDPFAVSDKRKMVTVWKHSIDAQVVDQSINEWFSECLQTTCYLVKMDEKAVRHKSLIKAPRKTLLSFADGYPYLILGTASMKALNEKLDVPVTLDRFRANIIIESDLAHVEDEMDKVMIGNIKYRAIKPCARCQVVTIDQKTAKRSAEPLKTLATYRKKANKIYFGMNAVSLEEGLIKVGDEIKKWE